MTKGMLYEEVRQTKQGQDVLVIEFMQYIFCLGNILVIAWGVFDLESRLLFVMSWHSV